MKSHMWLFVKWTSLRVQLQRRRLPWPADLSETGPFRQERASLCSQDVFPDGVFSSATMRNSHARGGIGPGNKVHHRGFTMKSLATNAQRPLANARRGAHLQSGDVHSSPLFLLICQRSEGLEPAKFCFDDS